MADEVIIHRPVYVDGRYTGETTEEKGRRVISPTGETWLVQADGKAVPVPNLTGETVATGRDARP